MVKRALLIGSNYTATPANQLRGCIDDIVNIHNLLVSQYGYVDANITVLRDDIPSKLPTKSAILAAFTSVLSQSGPADEIWVHYSGHGSQINVGNRLEDVIIPCDFTKAGFITADQLFDLIAGSKSRLLMFFDCCHSGTVCELEYSYNYNNNSLTKVINNNKVIANPNIIMISGCRDNQTSADVYDYEAKEFEGAFTDCLISTFKRANYTIDVKSLYINVCALLKVNRYSQIPVLSFSANEPSYQFAKYASAPLPPPVPVAKRDAFNSNTVLLNTFAKPKSASIPLAIGAKISSPIKTPPSSKNIDLGFTQSTHNHLFQKLGFQRSNKNHLFQKLGI
jgi:hypothetical protein